MRTRRNRRMLAGAAIAAAAIAVGCGDDGDGTDETTAGETQPLASFIAQADRICAEVSEEAEPEIQEAAAAANAGDPNAITEAVIEVTIPTLREQFDRMADLVPPEGAEEQVEEILATADEALAEIEEDPNLLVVEEGRETPFDEVTELERELGLKVCGGG